ncbi:MAG: LemA family protein [Patescibacteria group bacterium]
MNLTYILIGATVLIGGYLLYVYNTLSTFKVRVRASIQEIANQLKRQADLIPNLESSVKGYLKHEKGIFKDLTDARKSVVAAQKSGSLAQAEKASEKLAAVLPQIRIAVESNPEIKGSTVVTNLMDELRDTADKVMYSRRTLIDLTADYNTMLVNFPSNIVANMFGFRQEKGLETPESLDNLKVTSEETKTPKIGF